MKGFLKTMQTHLAEHEALVLVTIVAASGATPRGAGARMLVGQQGRICGTIGGGAVEYRSEQLAMQLLQEERSVLQSFSLNQNDVQNLGMVCGGSANVYFQYIPAGDPHTQAVIQTALAAQGDLWLLSDLSRDGRLEVFTRAEAPAWLQSDLGSLPVLRQEYYLEQILSAGKVYIFGAGHVARELEPVLTHVGFRCVVLDDRPEFADPALFPTAEAVLCVDFRRLSEFVTVTADDYVCIMTRGHASDTEVEAQVLRCAPRYNGMIGSRPKGAAVRKALQEEYGYSEEEIARIISPIGLPIGGKSPAEIAISIAAQMIAVRAQG